MPPPPAKPRSNKGGLLGEIENFKDENRKLKHVTPDEKMKVMSIIKQEHRKNQSGSLAVVKLYLSDTIANPTTWVESCTGIVSLTKEYSRKSYYIQIFDTDLYKKVWEQELYPELEYNSQNFFFHTFEAENNLVGLSFADDKEGKNFLSVVQKKISLKQQQLEHSLRLQATTDPRETGEQGGQ